MYDVVIIGAGVAGAALAASLGKSGKRVALIERDWRPPNTFVGELLQPGGYQTLNALGLADCVEGIDAQPVHGFAVVFGSEGHSLPYPRVRHVNGSVDQASGRSFHHGRFLNAIREKSANISNVDRIDGTVKDLIERNGEVCGVTYFDREGKSHQIIAGLTIAADGRNSKLRRHFVCGSEPRKVSHAVGLLLTEGNLPFRYHGNVFVTDRTPMLGYQIGSTDVRVLVDVAGDLPPVRSGKLASYLLENVRNQVPWSMRRAFREAVETRELHVMPNYCFRAKLKPKSGAILIGDALNIRHPITGSGMTVALNDARLLADVLAGVDCQDVRSRKQAVRRFYGRRWTLARNVDMLSGALYEVLSAKRPGLVMMRDAMLRYWQIGGLTVEGPMSLLSGLAPNPLMLLAHYTAVAMLGVSGTVLSTSSPASSWVERFHHAYQCTTDAIATAYDRVRA